MRNWKVTIEFKGQVLRLLVVAERYYADPCMQVEKDYPGCSFKNVIEIED